MKGRGDLYVSKRNRRGMLWILIAAILISFTPRVLSALKSTNYKVDRSEYEKLKLQLSDDFGDQKDYSPLQKAKNYKHSFKVPPKKFDPNEYRLSDWIKLGLSQKQAEIILKFSVRGIKSNEELQNIFVISDELFELIKDSTYYSKKVPKKDKEIKQLVILDLNSATPEDLDQLPGIGQYYAKKITDYRTRLGGFVRREQLLEIWNFDVELYEKIKDRVEVVKEPIKLNINSATLEELKAHPYIDYKKANSIIKMREQHGPYKSIDEIKRSKLIDSDCYEQLKLYLKVE